MARAQDWSTAQSHGGNRRSDQAAALPLETVAQRAAESGASERTQRMADKVAKADPELAVRVGHGEVSLPKAHAEVSASRRAMAVDSCAAWLPRGRSAKPAAAAGFGSIGSSRCAAMSAEHFGTDRLLTSC